LREGAIKTKQSDEYDDFYVEIPHFTDVDPLTELSTELEDLSVAPDYNSRQGLSHEQVTEIARDALQDARKREEEEASEPNLFNGDPATAEQS
jgi:hypothetical protein